MLEGGKGVMCDGPVEMRLGRDEEDNISLCQLKNSVLCKGNNIKSGLPKYICEVQVDHIDLLCLENGVCTRDREEIVREVFL